MKTITRGYKTYNYDELSKEAQDKAITDLINFYLECVPYENMSKDMKRACDNADKMQTPWFTGNYIWDYCKEDLEKELMENTYLENGKIING